MTGLDGRSFEFFGKAGGIYNVLSEKNQQLSMALKEGQMWGEVFLLASCNTCPKSISATCLVT